jgi:DNA-binding winged helix-turn-helix (wHTH) protein/tetratricopeptide (TPR) repeat protein
MGTPSFRFGDYRLDPAARELWRGAERISLPPKSFECLAYLVEHRERAVGRDELISAVWGRADVNDALLAQTLLRARRAVGDTGNEQNAIRTVPRFGYRFVAPVDVDDVPPTVAATPMPAAPVSAAPAQSPQRGNRVAVIAIAALAVAIALVAWFSTRHTAAPTAQVGELAVVLPVELDERSPDAAWIRLGVMDYIASRLRTDGKLAVLPSERVVALGGGTPGDLMQQSQQRDKIRHATGATVLVQPRALATAQGWRLELVWHAGDARQNASGEGPTALAAATRATDALLARIGRRDTAAPAPAAPTASAELAQRIDAAMLAGDLAAARAAIDAAPAALRADAEVAVRLAQVDFRAGRIDEAEHAFGALRDRLTELPTAVQAQALMGLGAVAVRRNDYPAAERRYAEALAALGPAADAELAGNGYTGRGVARAALGRYDEALADFGRARVALERAGDQPAAASVDTNLALMESNRRRWSDAKLAFDRAIAVFERYDVRDNLAASLHGKTLAELALVELDAALADSARAWQLAASLENPVLVDAIRHSRVRALLAAGQLAAAATLLDVDTTASHTLPAEPSELLVRLALARGDAAAALTAAREHAQRHPGTDAELLVAIAAVAAGADALPEAPPAPDEPRDAATLALTHALRTQLRGDAEATLAAYAQALAAADRDGTPDRRIDASRFYLQQLVARRELDRASAVAGDIAPYADRDFRAARALAQLYRALDDQALLAQANARVKALAGERDAERSMY